MAHLEHANVRKIDAKSVVRRTAWTLWLAPQVIVHAIMHPLSPTYAKGWFVTNWLYRVPRPKTSGVRADSPDPNNTKS